MANTYTPQDALTLAQKMGKGVPFSGIDLTICNIVNSTIYKYYPWRDTLVVIPNPVSLTDGNQDFSTGLTDLYRLTQLWITRTDVSPTQTRNIRVASNLAIDLVATSPYSVREACYQPGVNKFRLEKAVRVPNGATFVLGGEYQPHPTKITDLQDTFWFSDEHLEVFAHGLTYWALRLADDKRAGEAQKQDGRPIVYTGQLAVWHDAIEQMAAAEDFGTSDGYYPDDSFGSVDGRRYYANDLFPYLL